MRQLENSGTEVDLMRYRLERAGSDIKAARVLFEAEEYMGANNRAYYAIFHAISAIHALDKKHTRGTKMKLEILIRNT